MDGREEKKKGKEGAHRDNVVTCNQSGEWHAKDGNDAA